MRRYDAPRALHHELHEKRADREHDGSVRVSPQRNHRQGEQRSERNPAASAELFGQRAEADTAS